MFEKNSTTLVQKVWKTKYQSRKALSWSNFSRILNQFKKSGYVVKLKLNQEIKKVNTVLEKLFLDKRLLSLRKVSVVV